MCESEDLWRPMIRRMLDKDKWARHRRAVRVTDSEGTDSEGSSSEDTIESLESEQMVAVKKTVSFKIRRCWSGKDSGEGSGGDETSGEKKTMRQENMLDDCDRKSHGLQPVRWQVIRRKGQGDLLLGSVHPYPSDEQEPRIKPRPVKQEEEWCVWCGMLGWPHVGGLPGRRLGCREEQKGFLGKSDYPEKDS